MCGKSEPKFRTDDLVRVRASSGVYERRGHLGTVISWYAPGDVDVKFLDSQTRYTFHENELELVDRRLRRKFKVNDRVRVTGRSGRQGQEAVVKTLHDDGSIGLLFPDVPQTMNYGSNEVELLEEDQPKFHGGETVRIDTLPGLLYSGWLGVVAAVLPNGKVRVRLPGGDTIRIHQDHLVQVKAPVNDMLKFHGGEKVRVNLEGDARDRWPGLVRDVFPSGKVKVAFGVPGSYTYHQDHLVQDQRYPDYSTTEKRGKQPRSDVKLIGLIGRKQVGKDTFAARLIDVHGYTRLAFADNVRKAALAIDPFVVGGRLSSVVSKMGWEEAKQSPEVRRILQRLGTEAVRAIDPEFWVKPVMKAANKATGPVVITDVRFTNEADAIRQAGGILVRIRRPSPSGLLTDQHASETELDEYPTDAEILNNGSLEDLVHAADRMAHGDLER